ncbi:hypothetical protein F4819DRAFT_470583 [Hypoxylon fuscum]|nr:hypothetical protein F4819DRAFT_470583 [Hypoxylon fuscum]
MSTNSLRKLTCLSKLSRQITTRHNGNIISHISRINQARPISSTPRRPAKAREVAHRNTFAEVRFTASDVPPLSFFTAQARPPLVTSDEVTPSECFEACQQYARLAVEDSPGWRQRALTTTTTTFSSNSTTPGKIPLYVLHYAAVMLMQSPTSAGHLATHILHTGVTLAYAPSILTIARLGLKRHMLDRPHFAPAKEALERLAAARAPGQSDGRYRPDALALLGLAHAQLGSDDRALWLLGGAAAAAKFQAQAQDGERWRAPTWHWGASAVLEQAKILARRRQADRARDVLREAARELDNADVCYQYALLLGEDDPERTAMLQRAAISGVEDAAREMGQAELRRLQEEEGRGEGRMDERERRDRRVIAEEWLGVAGDRAII